MSVMAVEGLSDWATERLECEITVVAAHLAAGECRWLELIAEFDRREAWRDWGCQSTAHWLNWRCGLALGAGRERVRVARRLGELPAVAAAFSTGELSYSKVRAITRVATADNQTVLVDLARHMTASQVETTVRCYRSVDTTVGHGEDPAGPVDRYQGRFLYSHWNDDGTLSIRAKLPPAEGAVVLAALQRAADALYRDAHRRPSHPGDDNDVPAGTPQPETATETEDVPAGTSDDDRSDVPAGTSDDDRGDVPAGTPVDDNETVESPPPFDGWAARQVDALVALAETVVADGLRPGSGPNRHNVIIHLHTTPDDDHAVSQAANQLDNGPVLSADTARRLMCDASLTFALHGPDGKIVNLSPRTPTIPTALARAVRLRDRGCVFPGCSRQAFVDAHHINHRGHGGPNSLTNLCALCRPHHRMVHEGGYTITTPNPGTLQFHRPDGTPLTTPPTVTVAPGDHTLRHSNTNRGVHPHHETIVSQWDGQHPHYPDIIDHLLHTDAKLDYNPPNDN